MIDVLPTSLSPSTIVTPDSAKRTRLSPTPL